MPNIPACILAGSIHLIWSVLLLFDLFPWTAPTSGPSRSRWCGRRVRFRGAGRGARGLTLAATALTTGVATWITQR